VKEIDYSGYLDLEKNNMDIVGGTGRGIFWETNENYTSHTSLIDLSTPCMYTIFVNIMLLKFTVYIHGQNGKIWRRVNTAD
jgi:hypothetical protein